MSQHDSGRLMLERNSRGPVGPSALCRAVGLLIVLPALCLPPTAAAIRGRYEYGDWVSWTCMRQVNAIVESRNVVYVATDGGIGRYDLLSRRWRTPLTISDGLMEREIVALYVDEITSDLVYMTGRGFVGAFSLAHERDNPFYNRSPETDRRLRDARGPDARPAIPPPGFTLGADGALTDEDLRRYETVDQVVDFWDNMWLAVRGLGLVVRQWDTAHMTVMPYSLWNDNLAAIDSYGDNYWFVGPGAINVHHRDLDAWARFEAFNMPELIGDNVRDVVVESTMVWLATSEGLSGYDGRTGRWRTYTRFDRLPASDTRCLAADTGSVWVGTAFGVARLDRGTGRVHDASAGDYAERTIHDIVLADRAVWIATDAGVRRSRDRGKTWQRFTGGEPLLSLPVHRIEVDGDVVWFASEQGVAGFHLVERYRNAEETP